MTGPDSGGTERGTGAPARSTGSRGAAGAVLIVLAVGLALRLIIAYLLPGSGFKVDLDSFQFWAADLATNGPWGFYERDFFHDYTPGYLYVLWLVGLAGGALGGIGDLHQGPADPGRSRRRLARGLDGARARWATSRRGRRGPRRGPEPDRLVRLRGLGAGDSFGVIFLLLGLRALWRDQPERAAIFTVIAAIIKPRLGILVPLVAVVTIRRALWPAGGEGDPARTGHPWRIVTTAFAGLATTVIVPLPFGLSPVGLVEQLLSTGGGYPYLTVNAYNPWALVVGDAGYSLANAGQWVCDVALEGICGAGTSLFMGIPSIVFGSALLIAGFGVVLAFVARRPDRLTLLVALAVLALAFFILPTRVHERYGFPFFALGAILAAISWRWRIAYVVLSVATFLNMYVVITTLYPGNPSIADWLGIGEWIPDRDRRHDDRDPPHDGLRLGGPPASGRAIRPVGGRARGRGPGLGRGAVAGRRSVAGGRARGPVRREAPDGEAPDVRPLAFPGSVAVPADVADDVVDWELSPPELPTWTRARGSTSSASPGSIRERWTDRSIRPDRSHALLAEGGGRLDRLDLWLLVLLVIASMTLRTFRLAEPYQMHFDEVYHARTATEFLQSWRYGESRRHLRVDPPASREVRDGRGDRRLGSGSRWRHERTRRGRAGRRDRPEARRRGRSRGDRR